MPKRTYTQDADLILKDRTAITASGAGQIAGSPVIRDLGAARFEGVALIDVSAIKVSAADESYRVLIQGSNSASFASGVVNLAETSLGAAAALPGGAQVSTVGRSELPFTNEQADVVYRYLRAYTVVAGTSPSITHLIYVGTQY
jgi:hypothetical protein